MQYWMLIAMLHDYNVMNERADKDDKKSGVKKGGVEGFLGMLGG